MIDCACGCGNKLEPFDSRNRPRKYLHGHHNMHILKKNAFKKGVQSSTKPFRKGHNPWNKGIEWQEMKGKNNPFYGKKHTLETRNKMSGRNNGNWRNGASKLNLLIRKSVEYVDWRKSVFIRDKRICQWCGSKDNLNADHIYPFSQILQDYNIQSIEDARKCSKLWDINNGRTLCEQCHRTTETYGFRKRVLDNEI